MNQTEKKQQKKWIRFRHRVVRNIAYAVLYPYTRLKFGIRVERFQAQGDRPYLILYNHQTSFDQFFVGMAFQGPIYYMATEDIFSLGWVSSLIRWLVAPIPIKKQTIDIQAVMNCIRVAREGGTIAIAPEGNRTYSGRTVYMNPAIAGMAKKLKMPIALYRIEGGYGVQPRWSDVVRRGKMRGYVARVIEPEEYEKLSNEALMDQIREGLAVDEAAPGGPFRHRKAAEYLERVLYVCPDCGLTELESRGDRVRCKRCGKEARYLPSRELTGDFPFRFVGEWYDYQESYVNSLDLSQYLETPMYRDEAQLSEVIVYERKNLLRPQAALALYGDRIVVDEGREEELVFPFGEISAMSVLGRNKLNIYHKKQVYQVKSHKRFNALKYVNMFYRYKNSSKGDQMENFWDFNVWGSFNLIAVLLVSLLAANVMKKTIPGLQASLIPTSVLGGGILLLVAAGYKLVTGEVMFDTAFFGGNGSSNLELITYHCLALGFIASAFKTSNGKLTKQRTVEIFNTGITTVSTYLLQAIVGMAISMIAALVISDFFVAAGVLLPFGYGQGTGQALNYGNIYETEYGFVGGKSFGLTIAALGFLSASIGGVIHLNILRKKGLIAAANHEEGALKSEEIQSDNEIPMQESIDKMTIQIALIAVAYLLAYLCMYLLGNLLPGMKSVIYGFNFLLGVLTATVVKLLLNQMKKAGIVKKEYTNNFLMTRASNFFFDIMVVAGIAAIRLGVLENYWGVILIMGVLGLIITYVYNYYVAKTLFPAYREEQFLTMYGMLTGTASTGIILLREIDGDFKSPASDNMVYQNFPAIVFGFPMMLLATLAPVKPGLTMVIFVVFFTAMNILLFRSKIFKSRKTKA